MKIVSICGGLGNQMFQFAFYKSLEIINLKEKVFCDLGYFKYNKIHNDYELKKVFDIELKENKIISIFFNSKNILIRILRKFSKIILRKIYVIQKDTKYERTILTDKKKKYFLGYWQSEKFFKDIEEIIRKNFKFSTLTEEKNIELSKNLVYSNSVSIHIRRGDYLDNKNIYNILDVKYYLKAINLIKENVQDPLFIVFSDDIEWCKAKFKNENMIFVSWNNGEKSYRDMQLMSLCKHNIITNSSFSWWGAWLNNNSNKIVIAPQKWFADNNGYRYDDIIPESWIKL